MRWEYGRFGPARQVVGLVDFDKKFWQNEYLRTFQAGPHATVPTTGFHLRQHPDTDAQQLILLDPGIEAWVLAAATSCGINPTDYNLPATPTALGQRTKNRTVRDDSSVREFLLEIRRRYPAAYQHLAEYVSQVLTRAAA